MAWVEDILHSVFWPYKAEHRAFATRLTPAESCDRLRARVGHPFTLGLSPPRPTRQHPVLGTVTSQDFCIRRAVPYFNVWQTSAYGRFIPEPGGTRVAVRLSVQPLAIVTEAVALAFLLVYELFLIVLAVLGPPDQIVPPILLLFGPAGAGLLILIHWIGREFARGEDDFLVNFLQESLDATEVSGEQ